MFYIYYYYFLNEAGYFSRKFAFWASSISCSVFVYMVIVKLKFNMRWCRWVVLVAMLKERPQRFFEMSQIKQDTKSNSIIT